MIRAARAWWRRVLQRHLWELPPAAWEALAPLLRPNLRTLETGSGRSTHLFEAAGCRHVALEHDPRHAPPCASVVIAPLVGEPPWYDWRPEHAFDLVLVDGPPGRVGRAGILRVLPQIAAAHTVFVLDDTHRAAEDHLADTIRARLGLERRDHRYTRLGVACRISVLEPRVPPGAV